MNDDDDAKGPVVYLDSGTIVALTVPTTCTTTAR